MLLLLFVLICALNRGILYAQEQVLSENRVYVGYRLSDGYYSGTVGDILISSFSCYEKLFMETE